MFPEYDAGGFSRHDQIVQFYSRIRALLAPEMSVLEFGAGRGKWDELLEGYRHQLVSLRGDCRKLTGTDVDAIVLQNPMLDEAVCFTPGDSLPFEDEQFDMIISWAVFEHIEQAEWYAQELGRVLKPGGWLCAWTPNKWGYVGIGARLVPDSLQVGLLRFFAPAKRAEDSFPTRYRMNSLPAIRRLFPADQFRHCSYVFSGPPVYHANRSWLARIWMFYNWLMPEVFGQSLHVFIQKRISK